MSASYKDSSNKNIPNAGIGQRSTNMFLTRNHRCIRLSIIMGETKKFLRFPCWATWWLILGQRCDAVLTISVCCGLPYSCARVHDYRLELLANICSQVNQLLSFSRFAVAKPGRLHASGWVERRARRRQTEVGVSQQNCGLWMNECKDLVVIQVNSQSS